MSRDAYYIIAILLLLLALGFAAMHIRRINAENKSKDTIIAEKNDSIRYHKNETGRVVAEKLAAEATAKELAAAYPKLKEELLREFDVKLKDVKAYVKNTFQATGSGNAEIHNHYTLTDSSGRKVPYWELRVQDGYLDFRTTVIDSLHSPYSYAYTDTITTVFATKREHWYSKRKLYASSSLKNKNAKVIGTTNMLVKDYKDQRFILTVGVSYLPFENRWGPSINFGYKLFGL